MTKNELIAKLEGAKEVTSVVSIDLVLAALGMLEDPKPVTKGPVFNDELIERLSEEIESALDYNSGDLVDTDTAEFSMGYDNRIELERVEINVRDVMEHVTAKMQLVLEAFELEAADEANEADAEYEATLS
jgi:regulator of protease activity HflC (stomatin/prohibitin superfamily)